MDSNDIEAYTDGACKKNPGPGGWGIVLIQNKSEIYHAYGGEPHTTNNRMEISAILVLCKLLHTKHDKFFEVLKFDKLIIFSDSMLCLQTIAAKPTATEPYFFKSAECDGWMKKWKQTGYKDKKNVDLWKKVDKHLTKVLEIYGHSNIGVQYVKGHSKNFGNDLADKYANEGVVYEL
jgi:ribonuclease HI